LDKLFREYEIGETHNTQGKTDSYKVLLERNKRRPRCGCEDNIKMNLNCRKWGSVYFSDSIYSPVALFYEKIH
jgi:hypothetical protein